MGTNRMMGMCVRSGLENRVGTVGLLGFVQLQTFGPRESKSAAPVIILRRNMQRSQVGA